MSKADKTSPVKAMLYGLHNAITGGLGCCAREANEVELAMGRTCQNCSMVRTEWDDTVYICDPRNEKVSDGMTCNAFDAT